jgi:hypothetical protein
MSHHAAVLAAAALAVPTAAIAESGHDAARQQHTATNVAAAKAKGKKAKKVMLVFRAGSSGRARSRWSRATPMSARAASSAIR